MSDTTEITSQEKEEIKSLIHDFATVFNKITVTESDITHHTNMIENLKKKCEDLINEVNDLRLKESIVNKKLIDKYGKDFKIDPTILEE